MILNIEDLSFLKINRIMEMYFNLDTHKNVSFLKKHIAENKKIYNSNKKIYLPDVIKDIKDIFVQIKNYDKINFISDKNITSDIIKFSKENIKKSYKNKIVCIENADPGYDFLFNKGIDGLVI